MKVVLAAASFVLVFLNGNAMLAYCIVVYIISSIVVYIIYIHTYR